MRPSELVRDTGMSAQAVGYWLPRMVDRGTALRIELEGVVYYSSQPILHSDEIDNVLNAVFEAVLENYDEFFVFGQAGVPSDELIKNNIAKSLNMYCISFKNLDRDESKDT